jgi:uncharacterized membrane protein YhaH (DUF805 family)
MERSDFWTHVLLMIIAFAVAVLPHSIINGFSGYTLTSFIGVLVTLLVAIVGRFLTAPKVTKGDE